MPELLIIKTGSTLPSLVARKGDFEDWVLRGMGMDRGEADILDVTAGAPLPSREGLAGIIITGSHAMVTDRPYRRGTDTESALAELRRCAGSQFDPRVVEAFCAVIARLGVAQAAA